MKYFSVLCHLLLLYFFRLSTNPHNITVNANKAPQAIFRQKKTASQYLCIVHGDGKNRKWLHPLIRNRFGEGKVASDSVLPAPPPSVPSAEAVQCSGLVAASMCSYWAADLAYHITDRKCYASLHLGILSRHFQHRHAWLAVSARRRGQRFFRGGSAIFPEIVCSGAAKRSKGSADPPNCLEGPALALKGPSPTSTMPC